MDCREYGGNLERKNERERGGLVCGQDVRNVG